MSFPEKTRKAGKKLHPASWLYYRGRPDRRSGRNGPLVPDGNGDRACERRASLYAAGTGRDRISISARAAIICHSQQIRPLRDEVARYGHYSLAAESMYDHPFQWGSKRTGPDLPASAANIRMNGIPRT
jgi:hypothetical protein